TVLTFFSFLIPPPPSIPPLFPYTTLFRSGYNEVDRDNDLNALLTHLTGNRNVHVFTVTYSNDADGTTLRRIAQTTTGWNFDSRRSEEHTSELQSPYDLVCRLLLEKKKKRN